MYGKVVKFLKENYNYECEIRRGTPIGVALRSRMGMGYFGEKVVCICCPVLSLMTDGSNKSAMTLFDYCASTRRW